MGVCSWAVSCVLGLGLSMVGGSLLSGCWCRRWVNSFVRDGKLVLQWVHVVLCVVVGKCLLEYVVVGLDVLVA